LGFHVIMYLFLFCIIRSSYAIGYTIYVRKNQILCKSGIIFLFLRNFEAEAVITKHGKQHGAVAPKTEGSFVMHGVKVEILFL